MNEDMFNLQAPRTSINLGRSFFLSPIPQLKGTHSTSARVERFLWHHDIVKCRQSPTPNLTAVDLFLYRIQSFLPIEIFHVPFLLPDARALYR